MSTRRARTLAGDGSPGAGAGGRAGASPSAPDPGPLVPPTLPGAVLRGLLGWSLVLLAVHVALHLTWRFRSAPAPLRDLFAFASEDSLVTWTSIVTMFSLGIGCVVLGARRGERGWKLAGGFFVFLSLDDGSMLHERLGWMSGVRDGAVYSWIYVVLPFLAAAGLLVFVQVWRGTLGHRAARRHASAAFVLWGIALALEVPEKALRESGVRWRGFQVHRYPQLVEEWCELVAPGVLLAAVLMLLAGGERRGPSGAPAGDGGGRPAS